MFNIRRTDTTKEAQLLNEFSDLKASFNRALNRILILENADRLKKIIAEGIEYGILAKFCDIRNVSVSQEEFYIYNYGHMTIKYLEHRILEAKAKRYELCKESCKDANIV